MIRFLCMFTVIVPKIQDDNQKKAGDAGAINVILRAMKTHIESVDVCKFGCGALWSITDDNGKYV